MPWKCSAGRLFTDWLNASSSPSHVTFHHGFYGLAPGPDGSYSKIKNFFLNFDVMGGSGKFYQDTTKLLRAPLPPPCTKLRTVLKQNKPEYDPRLNL